MATSVVYVQSETTFSVVVRKNGNWSELAFRGTGRQINELVKICRSKEFSSLIEEDLPPTGTQYSVYTVDGVDPVELEKSIRERYAEVV